MIKLNKPKFWDKKIGFISITLLPITLIYIFLNFLKKKFVKVKKFQIPVICVGNIYLGGTGKTPVVERFAKELLKKGRKVAVLSRGYKSKQERAPRSFANLFGLRDLQLPNVVSDGEQVFLNSEQAGDEPYMLAKNLPGVVVISDKNRVKAGRYAIEEFGVDTIILFPIAIYIQ